MSNPLIRALSRTIQQIYRSGASHCGGGIRMASQALETAQGRVQSAVQSAVQSIDGERLARTAGLGLAVLTPGSRLVGGYFLGRDLYHHVRKDLPRLLHENYGRPLSVNLSPAGRRVSKNLPLILHSLFDYLNIYISPFGTERYFPTTPRIPHEQTAGAIAGARAGAAAIGAAGVATTVHHFRAVPMADVIGEDAAREIMDDLDRRNREAGPTENRSENPNSNEPVEHLENSHAENE